MDLKKIAVDGAIYDVINEEDYIENRSCYINNYKYIALIRPGFDIVYPIRRLIGNPDKPGAYDTGYAIFYYDPVDPDQIQEYNITRIIDYSNAQSLRDVIATSQRIASAEASILTTIDNVFVPEIGPNDTPEMIAFKQAIIDKHIDLDKYEQRFGQNYNNDKRLLKKPNITFGKLRDMCNALDIKVTVKFEDMNPDVPNPMGRQIVTEITGNPTTIEE